MAPRIEAVLRAWFGEHVAIRTAAIVGIRPMLPEEEACVRRAVPKRVSEFSTGRWCARQALEELGIPSSPILVGARREPLWPVGVTGSISHASGYCAVVAARVEHWRAIGIDLLLLEDAARMLDAAAWRLIAAEGEAEPGPLLFSAKESAIKALSGALGRFVDFTEVRCVIDEASGFEAAVSGTGLRIGGWWRSLNGWIVTAAGARGTGSSL